MGDFNKIIPLTELEIQKYITDLKNTLDNKGNHEMTNFEIVLLKTLEKYIKYN